jgi:transcriptional regulator with XRE-family HTH domain
MCGEQKNLRPHESVVNQKAVTATDRVRQYLRALSDDRRFKQTKIAARLQIDQAAVNRYIHGSTPITVSFLEAVSQETGIPIAELVAQPGTTYQLNADEALIVRALRKWPASVGHALRVFLEPFADEEPALQQQRNLHELLRRMSRKQRDWLYAVALLLREGTLAPDLQARLLTQLEADQQAFVDDPEGR